MSRNIACNPSSLAPELIFLTPPLGCSKRSLARKEKYMSSSFQNPESSVKEAVKGWLRKVRIGNNLDGHNSLGYELEGMRPL